MILVPGNPDPRKVVPGELAHHGVKGMRWGVWNEETAARYAGGRNSTRVSTENYNKINELYKSMPLQDRRMIDPDVPDKPTDYFKDLDHYNRTTAYNKVTDDGFLVAERIPKDKNVDGTKGVEIGIGVKMKGQGIGTEMTRDLVRWFDSQDDVDVLWWPVDEHNAASKRIAEKNGFIKDPYGVNYVYAKDNAYDKLGIRKEDR